MTARRWLPFLAMLGCAAAGWLLGRATHTASNDTRSPTIAEEAHAPAERDEPPRGDSATPIRELETLQGKRFLAVLPEVWRRAQNGNVAAMRVLDQRLDSCAYYVPHTDEEREHVEDTEYAHQLEITRQLREANPGKPLPPQLDEQTLYAEHQERLRLAFEQDDLCRGLSAAQLETRIDWAQRLVDAGDRDTILGLVHAENRFQGAERLRNAERLVTLAESERAALDRLIASGDIDALDGAMNAYGGRNPSTVVAIDAERAYAYAYALSLAADDRHNGAQHAALEQLELLERGNLLYPALSPAQIEQARNAGVALFKRCCSRGAD